MILWQLGGEAAQQLGLEGPVGVGNVIDGVQDATELLDHLLRESWQDQVEARTSANQERLSQVQKGGSFTLVGAACWVSAGAHPGGSGGKRLRAPPSPRAPE